jgi:hypothetical protein
MNKKSNLGYLPVIAGALGLGWIVKKYTTKIKKRDGITVFQKIKNAEQKLYQDGLNRANQLDSIKTEIQTKVRTKA